VKHNFKTLHLPNVFFAIFLNYRVKSQQETLVIKKNHLKHTMKFLTISVNYQSKKNLRKNMKVIFCGVQGNELRALHLLGRSPTT
jgi:hypothetical protein